MANRYSDTYYESRIAELRLKGQEITADLQKLEMLKEKGHERLDGKIAKLKQQFEALEERMRNVYEIINSKR